MKSIGDFSPKFLVGQLLELENTTFKKSKFEETINRKQYYDNIIIILLLYIIIYDYLATIGYKKRIILVKHWPLLGPPSKNGLEPPLVFRFHLKHFLLNTSHTIIK